eukprot:Rmarinus@m.27833
MGAGSSSSYHDEGEIRKKRMIMKKKSCEAFERLNERSEGGLVRGRYIIDFFLSLGMYEIDQAEILYRSARDQLDPNRSGLIAVDDLRKWWLKRYEDLNTPIFGCSESKKATPRGVDISASGLENLRRYHPLGDLASLDPKEDPAMYYYKSRPVGLIDEYEEQYGLLEPEHQGDGGIPVDVIQNSTLANTPVLPGSDSARTPPSSRRDPGGALSERRGSVGSDQGGRHRERRGSTGSEAGKRNSEKGGSSPLLTEATMMKLGGATDIDVVTLMKKVEALSTENALLRAKLADVAKNASDASSEKKESAASREKKVSDSEKTDHMQDGKLCVPQSHLITEVLGSSVSDATCPPPQTTGPPPTKPKPVVPLLVISPTKQPTSQSRQVISESISPEKSTASEETSQFMYPTEDEMSTTFDGGVEIDSAAQIESVEKVWNTFDTVVKATDEANLVLRSLEHVVERQSARVHSVENFVAAANTISTWRTVKLFLITSPEHMEEETRALADILIPRLRKRMQNLAVIAHVIPSELPSTPPRRRLTLAAWLHEAAAGLRVGVAPLVVGCIGVASGWSQEMTRADDMDAVIRRAVNWDVSVPWNQFVSLSLGVLPKNPHAVFCLRTVEEDFRLSADARRLLRRCSGPGSAERTCAEAFRNRVVDRIDPAAVVQYRGSVTPKNRNQGGSAGDDPDARIDADNMRLCLDTDFLKKAGSPILRVLRVVEDSQRNILRRAGLDGGLLSGWYAVRAEHHRVAYSVTCPGLAGWSPPPADSYDLQALRSHLPASLRTANSDTQRAGQNEAARSQPSFTGLPVIAALSPTAPHLPADGLVAGLVTSIREKGCLPGCDDGGLVTILGEQGTGRTVATAQLYLAALERMQSSRSGDDHTSVLSWDVVTCHFTGLVSWSDSYEHVAWRAALDIAEALSPAGANVEAITQNPIAAFHSLLGEASTRGLRFLLLIDSAETLQSHHGAKDAREALTELLPLALPPSVTVCLFTSDEWAADFAPVNCTPGENVYRLDHPGDRTFGNVATHLCTHFILTDDAPIVSSVVSSHVRNHPEYYVNASSESPPGSILSFSLLWAAECVMSESSIVTIEDVETLVLNVATAVQSGGVEASAKTMLAALEKVFGWDLVECALTCIERLKDGVLEHEWRELVASKFPNRLDLSGELSLLLHALRPLLVPSQPLGAFGVGLQGWPSEGRLVFLSQAVRRVVVSRYQLNNHVTMSKTSTWLAEYFMSLFDAGQSLCRVAEVIPGLIGTVGLDLSRALDHPTVATWIQTHGGVHPTAFLSVL